MVIVGVGVFLEVSIKDLMSGLDFGCVSICAHGSVSNFGRRLHGGFQIPPHTQLPYFLLCVANQLYMLVALCQKITHRCIYIKAFLLKYRYFLVL